MTAADLATAAGRLLSLGALAGIGWVAWQVLAANAATARRLEQDDRADRDFMAHAAQALAIVDESRDDLAARRVRRAAR